MRRTPANVSVSLGQLAAIATSSIATIVTARFLGPDGRGTLTAVMSATTLAAAIGILGLPTVILRRARRNTNVPVATAALAALASTTVASAVVGTILLVPQHQQFERFGFRPWMYFLALALALLQVVTEAVAAELQSENRFALLVMARLTWTVFPLMAIALLAASGATAGQAFAGYVLVALIAGTGSILRLMGGTRISIAVRRVTREIQNLSKPQIILERLGHGEIRSAFGAHVNLTLLLLIYRLDVIILAVLGGPMQVGLYSIAYAAAELVWMYVNGISIVAAPKLVSATSEEAQVLLARELPRAMAVSVSVVLLGLASGPLLISALLGSAFSPSYTSFVILTPGIIAFVAFKLKATALNARAKGASLARLSGFLLAVNVIANISLIPHFGANGAATAASFTYVLGGALSLRLEI